MADIVELFNASLPLASAVGALQTDQILSYDPGSNTVKLYTANQLAPGAFGGSTVGITAGTTQTQAGATKLTTYLNSVDTNATDGNGVALPAWVAGGVVVVENTTAKRLQVYGNGSDTINGATSTVGITQAAVSVHAYFAGASGKWHANAGFGHSGSFSTELLVAGITSGTVQTQAGATLLTGQANSVDTNATAGNGVALPASALGERITVINTTALPIQVYGTGADTVNGATSTVGISQAQNSLTFYLCNGSGTWIADEVGFGASGGYPLATAVNGITAHSGGGQGSAVPLTAVMNRITTVAAGNDSVLLPVSKAGMFLWVENAAAANAAAVFPASGEAINALSANTAFSLAANKCMMAICFVAGTWNTILTA